MLNHHLVYMKLRLYINYTSIKIKTKCCHVSLHGQADLENFALSLKEFLAGAK